MWASNTGVGACWGGQGSSTPRNTDAQKGLIIFPLRIRVVPSEGIVEQVRTFVPKSTTLSVTCLPHHSIDQTLNTAVQLRELAYKVIPHIAARSLHSRTDLHRILRGCNAAGIGEVFVIGGNRPQPAGPYESALPALEDIAQYSGDVMAASIAGYPESHPFVSPADMLGALLAKQHLASNVVTQVCFSVPKILDYAAVLRTEGVTLPLWAGLSGHQYSPQGLMSGLESQPGCIAGIYLDSYNTTYSVPSGQGR